MLTGAVYNYAIANGITSTVTLTPVHTNGVFGASALSIENNAPATFSDGLDAVFLGQTGAATNNGGSAVNLAPGTLNQNLDVGLGNANTSSAGAISGTVTVGLTSDGSSAGLGYTALTSQTITINGQVYNGQGVWNVDGSGVWDDFSKWTANGGVPGISGSLSTGDTATFNSFSPDTTPLTVTVDGINPSLASITFNSLNQSYTVASSSGGTISLQSNATISDLAGNQTISAPLILGTSNSVTVNVANSGDSLAISGGVSGAGSSLTKTGAGTLTLAGTSNTYSGATNVYAGTFVVSGSISGTTSVTVGNPGNPGTPATLSLKSVLGAPAVVASAGVPLTNPLLINSNGTLLGAGAIYGGIDSYGTVAPTADPNGNGLAVNGSLKFESSSTLQLQLSHTASSPTPLATDYSKLTLSSGTTATLGGTVNVSNDGTVLVDDLFTIIVGGNGNTINQMFANAGTTQIGADTFAFVSNGQSYEINYGYDGSLGLTASGVDPSAAGFAGISGGTDVALLMVVPEPNSWSMLIGSIGLTLGLQRLRRRKRSNVGVRDAASPRDAFTA